MSLKTLKHSAKYSFNFTNILVGKQQYNDMADGADLCYTS